MGQATQWSTPESSRRDAKKKKKQKKTAECTKDARQTVAKAPNRNTTFRGNTTTRGEKKKVDYVEKNP